jgi:hypothetical protein
VKRFLDHVEELGGVLDWERDYPRVGVRGHLKKRKEEPCWYVTLNRLPYKGWMIQLRLLSDPAAYVEALERIGALKERAGGEVYGLLMFDRAPLTDVEAFLGIARDVVSDVYTGRAHSRYRR